MKWLKLNNLKRFIILGTTMFATILSIFLGSFFYVSKQGTLGTDYGGGAEYVVSIKKTLNSNVNFDQVANSIGERIDRLGVKGVKVNAEKAKDGSSAVRVQYPGITSENEKNEIEKLITSKPHLSLTDIYGNALFNDLGSFNSNLNKGTNRALISPEEVDWDKDSKVPIASDGATSTSSFTGKHQVRIKMESTAAGKEWGKATAYIASLPKGNNIVIVWLDLNKFIKQAKTNWPIKWNNANKNPFLFAYVNEKRMSSNKKPSILKKYTIPAADYLISSPIVSQRLSGRSFVIEGNFTVPEVQELARKINYGISNYKLDIISSNFVDAKYGSSAFDKVIIAGLIVFSLIAVFLIFNYGILGLLSTISIALYMFLTLTMFILMRGEFSPEVIAALIIGVGMSVDANIITFERLKNEIYAGSSIKKANIQANKSSLPTIFDANITTLIVAFVLFYFGTRNIVGLSVTLIISIFFTLVIMLGFTKIMSTLLVNTGVLNNRKYWLGIKEKLDIKIQVKLNKPDYIKKSKWFVLGSGMIISSSIIVFSTFAIITKNITGGFNLSQEFKGGTNIQIVSQENHRNGNLTKNEANEAKSILTRIDSSLTEDIKIIYANKTKSEIKSLSVNVDRNIDLSKVNQAFTLDPSNKVIYKLYSANTSTSVAVQLVKDAIIAIAIAIAFIVIYTLIRFKWTYSFAAIVALVHDGLIVTAIFIITRTQISPVFVAGLLTILGYSINDTIVTFDRVREKMNNHLGDWNKKIIKKICNEAIRDTIKRSILTSLTTIIAVIILMFFGNATKMSFNFAMLIGLTVGTYSSIVIATYLLVKLETFRQNRSKSREKSNFWKTKGIQEQVFSGINDFIA